MRKPRTLLTLIVVAGVVWQAPDDQVTAQSARSATYDFTRDGTGDLLFRSATSVGFWDLDPGGVINFRYIVEVDLAWTIQGAGDYNGDGPTFSSASRQQAPSGTGRS